MIKKKNRLEFNATGRPEGSSQMLSSARDWARIGLLDLNDGVVGGKRILHEGWVRFFFSSRRRHTRSLCDWSSDVCSSDLIEPLAVSGNEAVQFTPMLLLGEPGLGKTYFAKKLAHALGTGFEFVSMSSLTAGWVLTGASAQWHNARPGKVAQTLIEGEYANPVVVLDEVDKTGGDSRYDPMGALYALLERDTASHFKDEFIDVDMDASHILWIATANDENVIPEPILNRMNVYPIERPDAEGSRRIAIAVYREILDAHHWPFPPEPPDAVIERLATVPPRDMRKLLLDAFGTARLANRDYLVAGDIDAKKLCGRKAR